MIDHNHIPTKKIIAVIWLAVVIIMVPSKLIRAESQTDDALEGSELISIEPDKTTEKLKERIEKIVEEKKDKIQGAIDELSMRKIGFIGQVERVTQESLTVKSKLGSQIIPVDDQVELVKKNSAIELDEVAVGDWLILMGYLEDDTFSPRRIVVSTTSLKPRDHLVMFATIDEISRTSLTVIPRTKNPDEDQSITLTLNSNTAYQDYQGEEAARTDFEAGMQVLLVGYQETTESDTELETTITPTTTSTKKLVTTLRALAQFDDEE